MFLIRKIEKKEVLDAMFLLQFHPKDACHSQKQKAQVNKT